MHTKVKQNRKRSQKMYQPVGATPARSISKETCQLHGCGSRGSRGSRTNCFLLIPLSGTADTDPEPGDAIRTLLPDSPDLVVIENCIIADARYVFKLSLGDQHSIKWVPIRPRQIACPN